MSVLTDEQHEEIKREVRKAKQTVEKCQRSFAAPTGYAGLAELKRQLERTGYEARGGNYRRHRRDSILEDAAVAGLRALAELESALERIQREARHNDQAERRRRT